MWTLPIICIFSPKTHDLKPITCSYKYVPAHIRTQTHTRAHALSQALEHTHTHTHSLSTVIPISLYIKNVLMLIVTKLAKYFPSMCSQNALGTCTIKNKKK